MSDHPGTAEPVMGPASTRNAARARDGWVERILPFVEAAIDELVRSYVAHPFVHRVEHSLHAQLFRLLTGHPELDRLYPLGDTGYSSGLVHKEWPETTPRASKASATGPARRGNFDLAILAPEQLATVSSIEEFTRGTIAAPIVIELGLGYGDEHLSGDVEKLLGSDVPHPYLVHLSHVRSAKHAQTEKVVMEIAPPLQIAYVRHDLDARRIHVKQRFDSTIHDQPDESRTRFVVDEGGKTLGSATDA